MLLGINQKETQQIRRGRAHLFYQRCGRCRESSEENLGGNSAKSQDMPGRRQKTGHSPGSAVIYMPASIVLSPKVSLPAMANRRFSPLGNRRTLQRQGSVLTSER